MIKELSDEIIEKLQKQVNYSQDESHMNADDILCELLEKLGYKEVVEKYNEIEKWYS